VLVPFDAQLLLSAEFGASAVTWHHEGLYVEQHSLARPPLHIIFDFFSMSELFISRALLLSGETILVFIMLLVFRHTLDEQIVHNKLVAAVIVEHDQNEQAERFDRRS